MTDRGTAQAPARPVASRPDGSMSLLVDMMRDAQDPSYAAARQRARTVTDASGHSSRRRAVAGAAVLIALGVATGAAAGELRSGAGSAEATRQDLVKEVRARTASSDALTRQVAALRRDVDARRAAGLTRDAAGRRQATLLADVQAAAAETPVYGPGVVVRLDDRPAGERPTGLGRGGALGEGRVQDRDLQLLVNGLWAAGAEAISVNDLRLTVRTAIRSAGEAILVDFRPLSPPYVVRAIGDPGTLQPDFTDGVSGRRLATYATVNGLGFDVERATRLDLPAGSSSSLDVARPAS